jgi:hypothetical protein
VRHPRLRRRTGNRARAMVDVSRWCKNPECKLLPAHLGECDLGQSSPPQSSSSS